MPLSRTPLSQRKSRGIRRRRRRGRIDDNGDRQARRNDGNGDRQGINNDNDDDSEVWKKYWEQVRESEGFDIVDVPNNKARGRGRRLFGLIVPQTDIPRDTSKYKTLSKYAELAIIQYNCEQRVDFEFISLEYANASVDGGFYYFFTIKTKNREAAGDGYELFQAKVWRGVKKVEVEFCRPKPKKPESLITGISSEPISSCGNGANLD